MTETEGFVRLIETMFTYMAVHVQPKAFSTHTLIMLSTYTHITIWLQVRNSNKSENAEDILLHVVRKNKWTLLNIIFARISVKYYLFPMLAVEKQ